MNITMIAAVANHNCIGFEGQKPMFIAEHAKVVMEQCKGKAVLMGRVTFEALGGPLSDCKIYVLTRNHEWSAEGVIPVLDLPAFIKLANEDNQTEVVLLGGSEIFFAGMPWADKILMTRVHDSIRGNVFMPRFTGMWQAQFVDNRQEYGETKVELITYRRWPNEPYPDTTNEEKAMLFAMNFARKCQGRRELITQAILDRQAAEYEQSQLNHQANGSV